eukprot:6481753-Amphidinium_carterae.1
MSRAPRAARQAISVPHIGCLEQLAHCHCTYQHLPDMPTHVQPAALGTPHLCNDSLDKHAEWVLSPLARGPPAPRKSVLK